MAWTTVSKPSAQTYSNVNPSGREQYDDPEILFDDPDTYYDGINLLQWTKVQSPSVSWNLSRATFQNSYSIAAQTSFPEALFFNPEGTKMYLTDGTLTTTLIEYNLATAWDLSTRAVTQTRNFQPTINYPASIFFKPDGLTMYIADSTPDIIFQYTLSTAWDISTATLLQSANVSLTCSDPEGMYFSPDGARMYLVSFSNDRVVQYDVLIPWDVSTIVNRQNFSVASQTTQPDSVYFKSDGKKMYISSAGPTSIILQYELTDPWNIATAVYLKTLVVSSSDINTFASFFRNDGLRLFITSATNQTVLEYAFTEQWTNIAKPN